MMPGSPIIHCDCTCSVRLSVNGTKVTACPEFLFAVVHFFTKGKPKQLQKSEQQVVDERAAAAAAAVAQGYLMSSVLFIQISQILQVWRPAVN